MIRISASDLQCYQRYRDTEEVTLEDCLAQLRRETPPNEAMLAGRMLHSALEHARAETETPVLQWKGYTFFFQCDVDLAIPTVRELKGEAETLTPSGLVSLVGVVDTIDDSICDYKLSARFDAERLAESWQWRFYLSLFSKWRFVYKVFVGEEIKPKEWAIRDYHELVFYRYAGMEEELQREIDEFAAFLKRYVLPARAA